MEQGRRPVLYNDRTGHHTHTQLSRSNRGAHDRGALGQLHLLGIRQIGSLFCYGRRRRVGLTVGREQFELSAHVLALGMARANVELQPRLAAVGVGVRGQIH